MQSLHLLVVGILCLSDCIGSANGLSEIKIKTLMAKDDIANNLNDVLTITFEGTLDADILANGGTFHLQISVEPDTEYLSKQIVFEELMAEEYTTTPTGYSVAFQCHSETGNVDIIGKILNKEIQFGLLIKNKADDNLWHSESVDVSLKGMTEFPTSPDPKFISDTKYPTGRWIRIGAVAEKLHTRAAIVDVDCLTAPCYIYENVLDVAATYRICNDVTPLSAENDKVYFCSNGAHEATDIAATGVNDIEVPKEIILDHNGMLQLIIADAKAATKVDLVVHKTAEQPSQCDQGLDITGTDPVNCEVTIGQDTEEYKILLVGYNGIDIKWTNDYTSKNHNLKANLIDSNLLEATWDHTSIALIQQFSLSRNVIDAGDIGLHEALVDCSAVLEFCSAYFFGVPVDGTYYVTLQDITEFNGGTDPVISKVSIRSTNSIYLRNAQKTTIIIHEETIDTKVLDTNMIVEVCFEKLGNVSMKDFHYEFLVVNKEGLWKSETKIIMKSESYACFESVEIKLANFKENSKALILMRNTKDRNVLASAEVKLQVPDVALAQTGDNSGNTSSNTVWIIVGTSAGFLACLVALVALIYTKIIRRGERDDGIQYPLQRTIIENSKIVQGLDNPTSTI